MPSRIEARSASSPSRHTTTSPAPASPTGHTKPAANDNPATVNADSAATSSVPIPTAKAIVPASCVDRWRIDRCSSSRRSANHPTV